MLNHPEMNGKGYGMPSSHAQFVAFFSISLTLFLLLRHVPHPERTHTPSTFLERLVLSLVAISCAGLVAASRVYLNYHTPKQVVAGCVAGSLAAIGWFVMTTAVRRLGLLDWALNQKLSRMLRMRDLVVTEDIMDAGWARWEARLNRPPLAISLAAKKKK